MNPTYDDADVFSIDSIVTSEFETEPHIGLCCCEYSDQDNKKNHLLGCCCNCDDFDLVFTRFITCRHIDPQSRSRMLLTFQDRLRIPWRGGAKKIVFGTVLPLALVPIVLLLATINLFTAVIMFVACAGFLGYAYHRVKTTQTRTRFFSMWLLWSVVFLAYFFEMNVPMYELLPEENIIFIVLTSAALYCVWRTRQGAALNLVTQSTVAKDELPDITEATAAEEQEEEEQTTQTTLLLENIADEPLLPADRQPNICGSCRKYVPPRTVHCPICGACIMRRDHHSFWLDCCVGEWNHRFYFASLVLGEAALVLGALLTLTSVCHPFLVVRVLHIAIMLPDDCSEVFEEFSLAISFVIGVYALIMAGCVLVPLLQQVYLISRGITMQECKRGQGGNRKTIWVNWRTFLKR